MRIGSLCSGYGGLEEGVRAVLGGTVAWHSEIDPGPCKVLAARYPGVPNLGDMTKVDWSSVERVDVLTGGTPCQDLSAAGKRAGMRAGTRSGLWASMCDAIDIIRPGLVVWENVRGALSAHADSAVEPCPICVGDERDAHLRALGRVVGDLAELGYVGRWTGLRAADVGAPHGRFRVFVVAWPADSDSSGSQGAQPATGRNLPDRRAVADATRRGGVTAAYAQGHGRHEGWPESAWLVGGSDAALGGDAAADTDRDRCEGQPWASSRRHDLRADDADGCHGGSDANPAGDTGRLGDRNGLPAVEWGPYAQAVRRWERALGRVAPSPTELSAKGQPRLSPAFVEWLMGLPVGWVTDVPGVTRNEALKMLGNGVVPQQAAEGLRRLLAGMALPSVDAPGLLPTPVVNDMGANKTPQQWDDWTARMKASHGNGNGHGASLSIEAARLTGGAA